MQMGLSQMPPGMMPPVGMMPPPPMTVDGGDFMAMQLPPGMPAMPSSARPGWPGTSMPMQGIGAGCSAPMVSSIPSDHSAQGPAFQHHSMAGGAFPHVPGRGEPKADMTVSPGVIGSTQRATLAWKYCHLLVCMLVLDVSRVKSCTCAHISQYMPKSAAPVHTHHSTCPN